MWKQYRKRIIPLLLAMLCTIGCMSCGVTRVAQKDSQFVTGAILPYYEQKSAHLHLPNYESPVVATWLPYFLYPDLFDGKTEAEAHQAVKAVLEFAKSIGINTVFAHACAFGYAILELLIRNQGKTLTADQIEKGIAGDGNSGVISVYIHYLRRKIDHGYPFKLLHTIRKSGYVLKAEKKHRYA